MTARWVSALLDWFEANRRAMPWRDHPDPYAVWVSEIMLQQTLVRTVLPFFDRFIRRFPDVGVLAATPLDSVLKTWEGLGYYTRARNLHAAAIRVISGGGRLPATSAEWRQLPGVGAYTAAAIASIAGGEAVPAIDGNVFRVMARALGILGDPRAPEEARRLDAYLRRRIPRARPGDFNQALMELGALVCKPRRPLCTSCPLRDQGCKAFRLGLVESLPVRRSRSALPLQRHVCGVVRDTGGRLLMARRKADGMLGGLWEPPGGVCSDGETPRRALVRVLRERIGIRVCRARATRVVRHVYSHFKLELQGYDVTAWSGCAAALGYDALEWIEAAALRDLPMHRAVLNLLS
jgi:A/G-specific adenine glycosylase